MDVSSLSTIREFVNGWVDAEGLPVDPPSPWGYLALSSGLHHAAAFAKLFWPDFIVVDGLVFLSERYEPGAIDPFLTQGLSPLEAAALLNHVHIGDLFPEHPEQRSDEVDGFLAQTLQESWMSKAARQFGEGVISVEFDLGLSDPQLFVLQHRLLDSGSSRAGG